MNLNFYPNDYNTIPLNGVDYTNTYNNYNNYNSNLQKQLEDNIKQLQQLQGQINGYKQPQGQQQSTPQNQPYYLHCGIKEDWDEFLMLNYGVTEKAIFDDYKLFLQAKRELIDEQGQNKINTMKDRIKNGNIKLDSNIKSSIKPEVENGINDSISTTECSSINDNNGINGVSKSKGSKHK